MPRVRIVADYGTDGYQVLDPAEGGRSLPVSDDLRRRLAAWNDRFERHCHPLHYEDVSGRHFDFVAFAADGLALARAVKRELPGWTVSYWDESMDWFLSRDPRRYGPGGVEYEISLTDAMRTAAKP